MTQAKKGSRALPEVATKSAATKKVAAKKVAAKTVAAKTVARKRAVAGKVAPNAAAPKRAAPKVIVAPAIVEAAPTLAAMTPKEALFVAEYLVDLNGTQAYMRAYPRASSMTARTEATVLLRKPAVAVAVEAGRRALSERAEVKAEEVVRRLGLMACADEREIMEVRVGCCRYCWGAGNRYHYTAAELERAEAAHAEAVESAKASGDFDPKGGVGFNANNQPSPDCPECFGDGNPRAVFNDTRNLSEGAALLFAGVKVTRAGFEIKTHSREAAIVNLGRHFGIFDDKLKLGGKVEIDATKEMLDFLRERGSRLPIADCQQQRRDKDQTMKQISLAEMKRIAQLRGANVKIPQPAVEAAAEPAPPMGVSVDDVMTLLAESNAAIEARIAPLQAAVDRLQMAQMAAAGGPTPWTFAVEYGAGGEIVNMTAAPTAAGAH